MKFIAKKSKTEKVRRLLFRGSPGRGEGLRITNKLQEEVGGTPNHPPFPYPKGGGGSHQPLCPILFCKSFEKSLKRSLRRR